MTSVSFLAISHDILSNQLYQLYNIQCPLSTFVGCTAPDPSNPVDECPVAGEFSEACNTGEFCCVDDCPRNYCTAKEAV